MKFLLRQWIVIITFASINTETEAQTDTSNASIYTAALENTIQFYIDKLNGYQGLYNGSEYIGSYPGTTGSPFFEGETLQKGYISFDGVLYQNIGLKYDLVSNQVIIKAKQNLLMALVREKIDYFSLNGHLFIHLIPDTARNDFPEPGFYEVLYEVLYEGPVRVLARRNKNVERGVKPEDPNIFRQYNHYYIEKNSRFYPISSQGELIAVFADRKEEMKNYLRRSKAKFKKDPQKNIVEAAEYYGSLKNNYDRSR
ncbi:MAG: hypothetical protein ICV66_10165 [Chitinophagaceae bacterium]|nr:hypothetical protein [Chitinophagaceae bacterium]